MADTVDSSVLAAPGARRPPHPCRLPAGQITSQVDLKAKEEEEEEEDKVKDSKDAKGAQAKVKAARIRYSCFEYPVLALAVFIASQTVCLPSIAFVFAEMLALFYSHDTDYIMDTAYMLGGIFCTASSRGASQVYRAACSQSLARSSPLGRFLFSDPRQDVAFFDVPIIQSVRSHPTFAPTRQLSELQRVRARAPHQISALSFGLAAQWRQLEIRPQPWPLSLRPWEQRGEMINMQPTPLGRQSW